MIYLSPAPLYHSAPQAAVNLTIRMGGTAIIMERFDPYEYLQLIERYSGDPHPARADDVQSHAQAARGATQQRRPVVARVRRARRRAVPGAGEGADDRVVGSDHPRVLRRHRRPGLHGVQQRGVARAQGIGRQGDPRRPAHPRRRDEPAPARCTRHDLVQDGAPSSSTTTIPTRPPRRRRPTAR